MHDREAIAGFTEVFGFPPGWVASSPGRAEIIGNHTDYNGGLVLAMTIDRRLTVAASIRKDPILRVRSAGFESASGPREMLLRDGPSWVRYVAGTHAAVEEACGRPLPGFDLFVRSAVPVGSGLSSSAALEMATAILLNESLELGLSPIEMARAGRQAENRHVGVPSGILDQGTVMHGDERHAVLLDARSETFESVSLPPTLTFWVFDPPQGHVLADGAYAARRAECEQALSAAKASGSPAKALAHVEEDVVHRMEADEPVRMRALHVVTEHARVRAAASCLLRGDLTGFGELLYASHESSRTCFENSSPQQDTLVRLLAETEHVRGARLTGGGFGGAVLAATTRDFGESGARAVAARFGHAGRAAPGILQVRPAPGPGAHQL